MRRLKELNFVASRLRITRWASIAFACAFAVAIFAGTEWQRAEALRDEVDRIEQRIDQRKRIIERDRLRESAKTPEQRHIDRMIAEQTMSSQGSGLPVIDWIEQAWTPQIALKSLTVDNGGREARIEGGAADLSHIYMFVGRLSASEPEPKIGLLQHRTKIEDGKQIFHFSLSIERP
ncbi:hypothetical protein K6W16_21815 [Burkholderia dolosa]|uniref:Fimbrial assembly family protein n=2 Tax=Burkholderia dolosa TaxID=152500 RepID=A0A892ICZ8_9BURK|nr:MULTISPECIES: hypothetical protein [Burkholderia]AKE05928.1 hypothetical protein XM57_25460 [Burkholderia cepacia]AJY10034.1 hypothetical protein AK34_3999 [Burkholderia dolosa AU0158]AYZ93739.1 hypothetical protein EGY28_00635 [Burkholderia dolosa]ETP62540.1 hypothetical protein BDSB_19520 [Burkholderia dolosa PC543]MBR8311931.1 hypothetical protein [Burkholderia dolosa]